MRSFEKESAGAYYEVIRRFDALKHEEERVTGLFAPPSYESAGEMQAKRCPFCRESLRADATFCRYCNRDLEDESVVHSQVRVRWMAWGLAAFFGGIVLLLLVLSLFNR